ncbi:MAG: ABC transporter permease [Ignavibacteriae bacterium]|nr:ABC transporter permease [Ignavibacteriota bacterium]
MKIFFQSYLEVLKRELSLVTHDKDIIIIILIAPVFYALFYNSIYINKSEKDVPVAVVDMDNSEFSKEFIKRLDAHQLTSVNIVVADPEEAKGLLNKMNVQGVIVISYEAEKNLKLKKGTTITANLNTTRFLVSNDINKAVNEVAFSFGNEYRQIYFQNIGYNSSEAEGMTEPLKSDIRPMFNTSETYGEFLIPGLLVLILHQTLLIGLSESIANEREMKTLSLLYELSGRNTFAAISGKLTFYFIVFGAYAYFFYVVTFSLFKINFMGSVSAVIIMTILFIISTSFFSVLISSFFKKKILSLQFLAFTSYPIFLVSGYVFPTHSMPKVIQVIADCLPVTPYLNAFIRITQMGAGWSNIIPQFYHLSIITVVLVIISLARMKVLFMKNIE